MGTATDAPAARFDAAVHARLLEQALLNTLPEQQWLLLEAAHVVGQTRLLPHLKTHTHMLQLAWRCRQWQEAAGQVLRLLLVPPGHALGRLPLGNPGRANVSAFQTMPVRADIADAIACAGDEVRRA